MGRLMDWFFKLRSRSRVHKMRLIKSKKLFKSWSLKPKSRLKPCTRSTCKWMLLSKISEAFREFLQRISRNRAHCIKIIRFAKKSWETTVQRRTKLMLFLKLSKFTSLSKLFQTCKFFSKSWKSSKAKNYNISSRILI